MVPLSTPQRLFKWLCVWPVNETGQKWEKATYAFLTIAFSLLNVIGLIASAAFCRKFISIDLEMALYAVFTVFGFGSGMYGVLFVFFSRHGISDLFEKLSKICDASKMMFFDCFFKSC